jgi:hypothetical protein
MSPQTKGECARPCSPKASSTASLKNSALEMGPYGAYNEALLPPSKDMKQIVGDMISMSGGTAAVLLQIAVGRILFLV